MSSRRNRVSGPSRSRRWSHEEIDKAAVAALVQFRAEHGRWPHASELPGAVGRDGVAVVGPLDRPESAVLMPRDPAVAARLAGEPVTLASWLHWDDGDHGYSAAMVAARAVQT